MSKISINIQPQAYDVYAMFMRLTNTEPFALGEFIDNSSASFYENKEKLASVSKLIVNINYDQKEHSLTIEDNAFGMNLEEFKRAIMVGSKTDKKGSRNEFGKGLKTAATWFGSKWSVRSTQLGSKKSYFAIVDVEELLEKKLNNIDISENECNEQEHYTVVKIENLNHDLNTSKIQKEIIEKLGSIYRRDLIDEKMEILFNRKPVKFEPNPVLIFNNERMYQNINFSINFNGQIYSTKGYVALSSEEAKVGANRTGFALFRVNRAIKINEKPYEIFGSTPNSPLGFKLYGELDMDDFEVNQAKDGLAWSPELKELFYNTLASNIQKIVSIGRLPWKKIHELEKPKVINTPVKTVPTTPKPENDIITSNNTNTSEITTITSPVSYIQEETPEKKDIIFNYAGNDFTIKIEELNNTFLYSFDETEKLLKLNMKHNFICNLSENEQKIAAKIILAFVISEENAVTMSADGFINPADIHIAFSNILETLGRK